MQTHTSTPLNLRLHEKDVYQPGGPLQTREQKPTSKLDATSAIIGWILQIGVSTSAIVILIGLVLLALHPGGLSARSLQSFPQTLGEVWSGLLALQPQAVIVLGLLLLIATPVLRVAVSVVAFALEHDRRYVVITLIVLTILLFSIFFVGNFVSNG